MKNLFTLLYVLIVSGLLSGCYMDAYIGDIASILQSESNDTTIAVAPSVQYKATDNSNQYKARSAVGEVTSGLSKTADEVYSAEVSITYQRL